MNTTKSLTVKKSDVVKIMRDLTFNNQASNKVSNFNNPFARIMNISLVANRDNDNNITFAPVSGAEINGRYVILTPRIEVVYADEPSEIWCWSIAIYVPIDKDDKVEVKTAEFAWAVTIIKPDGSSYVVKDEDDVVWKYIYSCKDEKDAKINDWYTWYDDEDEDWTIFDSNDLSNNDLTREC